MSKIEKGSDTDSENSGEEGERGTWDRKVEYMLSMLGFCVGLGNLWRFPYLCMKNGGGAFLIPFFLVLMTCGLPLYFMEVSIGQFTGKGAMHAWEVCPLFKGIGVGMVIFLSVIALYYNIIVAWSIHYFGSAFFSPLPWTKCYDNQDCMYGHLNTSNLTMALNASPFIEDTFNGTAANESSYTLSTPSLLGYSVNKTMSTEEYYWQRRVLHISGGIHQVGGLPWEMLLCFSVAWILIYGCLWRGVRSVGKVVYVTATMPYLLLFVILIRGLTLPGSANGIIFYLKPDFSKLLKVEVWIEAALQVFYSLGPTWGPLITMASYNRFNNNCYRDAIILTLASEGTSLYGGFAIFSILGFMAHRANLPIKDVVKSGPGLGFIAYPEALAQLPLPNLWAVLFFFMLITVGLDSQFGSLEAVCTAMTDSFPSLRRRRSLFTALVCILFFIIGIPMCTQGGMYLFQLLDWYIASICLPLYGLLECLIFGWIYGAEMFSRDVEMMLGRRVPVLMRIMWCFLTPFILLVLLGFTLVTYKPPKYGNYEYPRTAEVVGWFIAILPVIPIPVMAVKAIRDSRGDTFIEKIRNALKPSRDWIPAQADDAKTYCFEDRVQQGGIKNRLALNILGRN